ncbi:MAG: DUF1570 domain-containing protein [Pirellulales bacterium]|nr:DUF1570 domain-containing protein [Pirellulales bacterium]
MLWIRSLPPARRCGASIACLLLGLAAICAGTPVAWGVDHVLFRHEDDQLQLSGRVLTELQQGGLLFQSDDGATWAIDAQQLVERRQDDAEFKPLSADEVGRRVLAELPPGFQIHKTNHYVICYDTSRVFAQWAGALFERLYMAFTNYWQRKGFDVVEPEFPLVAVIFANRQAYIKFAEPELGGAAPAVAGYYSIRTNRITTFDLTGIETLRQPGDRRATAAQINAMLARPQAERTVATIVHEATHQIAFNCGLQTRYSDIPLWVSEGIAVYFETPDLSSRSGWRNIGGINWHRLDGFRRYVPNRDSDSLAALVTGDDKLRDPQTAGDAYSEAWALTYFLIRQRPNEFHEYMRLLSAKPRLGRDEPGQRLEEFKRIFGPLEELDAEFLRYMSKVR